MRFADDHASLASDLELFGAPHRCVSAFCVSVAGRAAAMDLSGGVDDPDFGEARPRISKHSVLELLEAHNQELMERLSR